jgi:hypothetical protein
MRSGLLAVTAISKERCETLIKLSQYLEVDEWPEGINFTYGVSEIEELAEKFGLNGRQCMRACREFKDSKGKSVSVHLQTLLTAVKTTPVSTTECERSFSGFNSCMSPQRAPLQMGRISTSLFMKLVGPPLP